MDDKDALTKLSGTQQSQRMLAGKLAIVTGSTSGIGLGIARALAEAGANVVLNGLGKRDEVTRTVQMLEQSTGVRITFDDANLMNPVETTAMVERAEKMFGRVDILVNNAGIQHVAPIESFPDAKWDAILALNLSAVFHATKAAFAGMKARKFGRIINVASAHGLVGSPFKSAYVAAKHGVVGLTKVTALEGAEVNVTANAICPGYVWTPLVEKQIDDQAATHNIDREKVIRDVLLVNQPNKKFATVEEMGALAVFLASDLAASITGTALPVDGGWTAH
ncbi:MAG: 3-hydroxybutyrate dehydrogenase [Micropepsaceae bacterium]